MAKEINFQIAGKSFQGSITKVDRDKVYGWTEERYFEKDGTQCMWANLLSDGVTLIASGGSALKIISSSGTEISRSDLKAVLPNGDLATLQKSVYEGDVLLESGYDIDSLLNLEVKSVYQLSVTSDLEVLRAALINNQILYFKFNYRTDYEADDAFVVSQGENYFIITGVIQDFEFSNLEKPSDIASIDETSENSLDFNMF